MRLKLLPRGGRNWAASFLCGFAQARFGQTGRPMPGLPKLGLPKLGLPKLGLPKHGFAKLILSSRVDADSTQAFAGALYRY